MVSPSTLWVLYEEDEGSINPESYHKTILGVFSTVERAKEAADIYREMIKQKWPTPEGTTPRIYTRTPWVLDTDIDGKARPNIWKCTESFTETYPDRRQPGRMKTYTNENSTYTVELFTLDEVHAWWDAGVIDVS
jgi:hypothetical protein